MSCEEFKNFINYSVTNTSNSVNIVETFDIKNIDKQCLRDATNSIDT